MNLKDECNRFTVLTAEHMQRLCDEMDSFAVIGLRGLLLAACVSHERLRAELAGVEVLLAEDAEKIKRLEAELEMRRVCR